LPIEVGKLLTNPESRPAFSAVSIWEIVIKTGLGREDFRVSASLLRRGLLENEYAEIAITCEHVLAVQELESIYRDPFDRLLIAQSRIEGIVLLTADPIVARYGRTVRMV